MKRWRVEPTLTTARRCRRPFLELKAEARRAGVSVAQYVREAVVSRMAYTAGLRGDPRYTADGSADADGVRSAAGRARADAARVRSESSAVRAESMQAKRARAPLPRARRRPVARTALSGYVPVRPAAVPRSGRLMVARANRFRLAPPTQS